MLDYSVKIDVSEKGLNYKVVLGEATQPDPINFTKGVNNCGLPPLTAHRTQCRSIEQIKGVDTAKNPRMNLMLIENTDDETKHR